MLDKLGSKLGLRITQDNLRIRAEQLQILTAALPGMIVANMVLEPLLVWLMWDRLGHGLLLSWLALLYLIQGAELLHLHRSSKEIATIEVCRRRQSGLLRFYMLAGALWGSAGIFMFIPGEPVLQAFLLCIMIGIAAAVVVGNQSLLLAQQLYVLLVMLPITFSLLRQDHRDTYLLAMMVIVFIVYVMKAGRDQSRKLELSIRRRFENLGLMEDLKRSHEQLKLAQRAAHAGVWEWDVETGRMSWTEELFRLFGLDRNAEPANYETWRKLLHPADLEQAERTVAEAIRRGIPLFNEYRIVLPDDRIRWIVAQGDCQCDAQGTTQRLSGLCLDITEQKEAQRRAQQAESRFQALIEHAGTAFLVHDMDGRLQEVNRQACENYGYSRDELLALEVADLAPNFDRAYARSRWAQLAEGMPMTFTTVHRRKDGTQFPVEVRLSGIVLNGQKMVVALINDITERMRFETALQRSEERYRTFAEKLPLGIAVLQDGLIKYVNQTTTEMIGYTVDELIGKPFPHLIHEDDRAKMVELHRRRMQGEDVEGVFATRMVRKDGAVRQWELHTSTTEWDGKRSSLGIMVDITERVAMEQQMRDSLRKLEEKELAKTRFLAAAGHDLRQPVAAANLFVEALKFASPNERQQELIAKLDQSMTVFSELLDRLLNISKFDAGLIKPRIVAFDLAELFDWLEQNFAESAQGRGLRFRTFQTRRRPLVVRTDIGLLQSVVMNLVSNAIKYTSRGGMLVAARLRGNQVLLQVWDSGCGISEADQGRIFDEFYQVDNPQRNREAGLGLGLSICQRATALMGSNIGCRSRLGRGSVFELSLLLDRQHQQVEHFIDLAAPADVTGLPLFAGKRVIVLEDDQLVGDGMVRLLQGLGAEVLHFHDAEQALQHQGIAAADYFVVDYSLGKEQTGVAFLQALQGRSDKPVMGVIVTGETASHFIEGAATLPWPVLHKPVNYAKLVAALGR